MKHKGAYSNGVQRGGSDCWQSPWTLFRSLNKEFSFTLNAAASADNALCHKFWNEEEDALKQDWGAESSIWCNPPYSQIPAWHENAHKAETTVYLAPTRMQALWWMRLVLLNKNCHEIRHLLRNPRFIAPESVKQKLVQPGNRSPQACCVLVFRSVPRKGEIRQTVNCADTGLLMHVINRGSVPGRPTIYDAEVLDQVIDLYARKRATLKENAELLKVPLRTVQRIAQRLA
jgi:phage N-6-adenine-methyltransferase